MVNQVWKNMEKCRVWLMQMPDINKKARQLDYKSIDKEVVALLEDKKIRITKSSSITPKGIWSVNGPSHEGKLRQKLQQKFSSLGLLAPNSNNLFFEMNYDYGEVRRIYDEIGGRQNNFPLYLDSEKSFEEYKKDHDIWIFEDTQSGRPVGFMTRQLIKNGTPEAKEYEDDFGYKTDRDILYMDTFALHEKYLHRGLGKDISRITDAYYLNLFGKECDFLLVTGDINTAGSKGMDGNAPKLSRDNHRDRGFEVVAEVEMPTSKYKKRWADWEKRIAENAVPDSLAPLQESYRRATVR